ncbi:endonuclease V [Candidatus Nanohaloarchaea archaeon]|nr:endonuclease V [Candidatus Nanohaloarchaea archaeon]
MEPVNPKFIPEEGLETEEMNQLQREIAEKAVFHNQIDFQPEDIEEKTVVGIDQAFLDDQILSGAVVLRDGEVIEKEYVLEETPLPYIPGLLAFREGHSIVSVLEKLEAEPDLLILDGSGRIHFREAGIATHIGVIFDIPALGIAKNLLCGDPVSDISELDKGEKVAIKADDRVETYNGVIGYAVQTKQYSSSYGINPVYVSPGHRLGEETAAEIALQFAGDYKLPRPTYEADKYVDEVKKEVI